MALGNLRLIHFTRTADRVGNKKALKKRAWFVKGIIPKDKIDVLFPNNKMNMNYLTIVLSRDKDSLNLEVVKKHTGTTPAVYKLKSRLANLPNGIRI